ncbi:hypothetical protein GQ44DRAFT_464758 [Phaeosphaeriaceae sp. PMI808]|nr:hypothetical protein GQ44DRAFT_464758 [Phaeosphaeriaceae sp. PMI808]
MAGCMQSNRASSRQPVSVLDQVDPSRVALPVTFGEWDLDNPDFTQFVEFDENALSDLFGGISPGRENPPLNPPAEQNQVPFVSPLDMPGNVDPDLLYFQPQPGANNLPFFDPSMQATPGLTAVPGATESIPANIVKDEHFQQYGQLMNFQQPWSYPDPMTMNQSFLQPYFVPPNDERSEHHPTKHCSRIESNSQELKFGNVSTVKGHKRARSNSDSDNDRFTKKFRNGKEKDEQSSEDESDCVVVERKPRLSDLSSSTNSDSLRKPAYRVAVQTGQKPLRCEEKPWVRINHNTKGETTRTARINEEASKSSQYKQRPLPHGDWESEKYRFEYRSNNNLDEFKKKKMRPGQIMEYITQYPSDDLRLWIQVTPADMARRYASACHSKCLFEDCPKHTWGDSGTIDIGHYRVAFDEKSKRHGGRVDPFDCAGYVHLYCLERFCDFETICKDADILVDTRVDLPRETGQAKWSMFGRPETELAQYFIKICEKGILRTLEPFQEYPPHSHSYDPKPFAHTLVNNLAKINIENRTRSQIRQFVMRKLTPNVLIINRGDMEMAMAQKKIKASREYRKAFKYKKTSEFDFEPYYDKYDPLINIRLNEYRSIKEEFDAEDRRSKRKRARRRRAKPAASKKKGKAAVHAESSDSEPDSDCDLDSESDDDYDRQPSQEGPTRASPRKPQRLNYAEPEPEPALSFDVLESFLRSNPSPLPPQPQTQPKPQPQVQTPSSPIPSSLPADSARKISLADLFPRDGILRLEDLPIPQNIPTTTADDIEALLSTFPRNRRRSSTLSKGPGYAGLTKPKQQQRKYHFRAAPGRQASFHRQPVSREMQFRVNDPPAHIAEASSTRRSTRLASRSGSL